MNELLKEPVTQEKCYHCGEDCKEEHIEADHKHFCCHGCKTVYEILNENNLCEYYEIQKAPGNTQKKGGLQEKKKREAKFTFLDDESVSQKLILFRDEKTSIVKFSLPQIHCSSCIWLLEHLSKINPCIQKSETDFLKKEITVHFDHNKGKLSSIAETLDIVGYEPHISLQDGKENTITKKSNKKRILRIGVAGFCFGNIMMLSFPEYFSFGKTDDKQLMTLFSWLNLGLSIPVLLFSAGEFFVSAWKSLKQKFLNIDAPIALAILITFGRSVYEIVTHTGPGYLDSMTGIVLFMLIGRYFQDKTHESVSFERDYKSYFPLGITRIDSEGKEEQIPVSKLKTGDRIRIYSEEIIPADSILFMGKANIDYSFVTGESAVIEKGIGEIIYAGGKQKGGVLEMEVIKEVSQSYLTGLWNNEAFKKERESENQSFIHTVSRYFSIVLFLIAICSAIYWQMNDADKVWKAVTSVLIVACPCTLLLSATFTNGFMMNQLKRKKFYLKNPGVIEKIGNANTVVFDKTGTITEQGKQEVNYFGRDLSETEKKLIYSLVAQSNHPLSRSIKKHLATGLTLRVNEFTEIKGQGICGEIQNTLVRLGSASYLHISGLVIPEMEGSKIYVSFNNIPAGVFVVRNNYRRGLKQVFSAISATHQVSILSGDNNSEESRLNELIGKRIHKLFDQSPQQKLDHVKELQQNGKTVIMLGDGLNDSGALMQSDAGIVITDDINNFTPASDVIMDGTNFDLLPEFISFCKNGKKIIYGSFIISILYNFAGMYYATSAQLQPVIAAILMPLSSTSIILFSGITTKILSMKIKKNLTKKSMPD